MHVQKRLIERWAYHCNGRKLDWFVDLVACAILIRSPGAIAMKHLISTLLVACLFTAFIADNANAIVCAHGVYRAGCVGRYGAVGVHRGYGYHRGYAVRRRVY